MSESQKWVVSQLGGSESPTARAELRKLADLGCESTRWSIVNRILDKYGVKSTKLQKLADLGWVPAQEKIVTSLIFTCDCFGFKARKLKQLAQRGWSEAQHEIAKKYAGSSEWSLPKARDHVKLRKLADAGCSWARSLIVEGFAEGKHGFAPDLTELHKLTAAGWSEAHEHLARILICPLERMRRASAMRTAPTNPYMKKLSPLELVWVLRGLIDPQASVIY